MVKCCCWNSNGKEKKYLKQQSVEGDRDKKRDRAKGTDPF